MTYDPIVFKQQLADKTKRSHTWIDRTIEEQTFIWGSVVIVKDRVADEDMWDLSHLGECDRYASDYCIDRYHGVLLGKYQTKTYWLTAEEAAKLTVGIKPTEDQMEKALWVKANADGWVNAHGYNDNFTSMFDIIDDDEEGEGVAFLEVDGRPKINDRLRWGSSDRGDRYFLAACVTGSDPLKEDPDLFDHIEEDYDRFENAGVTWDYEGCVVHVYFKGHEIGHEAVWGVDSDSDKEDFAEIFADLLSEIDIPKAVADKKAELLATYKEFADE